MLAMADALPQEISRFADDPGAVVVVDNQGQIVFMNEAAEKFAGVSLEDIRGEFVEMLVPEKLRWGHQAYRRGYLAEPSDREMDPGLEPAMERIEDETHVPIAVRLEPLRVDGTLYVAAHVSERTD
jgi:PAS domain S-box-containing protein